MVLKTAEEKVGEITRWVIIDGQQRLTTILLLMAVIRDRAKEDGGESLVKQIDQHFLFNEDAIKNDDKPKLRLTRADRDAFEHIIGGDGSASNSSQVVPAFAYFADLLEKHKAKYDLSKLFDTIRQLKLVTMRLDEKDNPNRIFETLNYRGKELAQSDLVRNLFMMSIRDQARVEQVYKDIWFPMEQGFGNKTREQSDNLELFLRHYMTMVKRTTVKEESVYGEIREGIKSADEPQVLKELRAISRYAGFYQGLLFPDRASVPELSEKMRRLNDFGISVHYPFVMKAYNAYESKTLSLEEFITILDTIESYVIRRYFQKRPTNALNKLFASLCSLPDKSLADSLVKELKSKDSFTSQYWPVDEEFKDGFKTFPIYQDSAWRSSFILTTIEERFKHPEPIQLDRLTVEHIMPETLTNKWKKYLGSGWETTFERRVHTIGNLTLIAGKPNSSLQQDLFKIKKAKWYKKSNVELTKELVRYSEWKEKDMAKRAEDLANRAVDIWTRP